MTPADEARANAITFECKKDALQQRQSGDWKISFTVQGVDMDERITRAAMGTRFVAVLVEINDQELPVQAMSQFSTSSDVGKRDIVNCVCCGKPAVGNCEGVEINDSESPVPAKEKPAKAPANPAGAKHGTRDWRDIPPANQAGMRCDEPIFAAFLREQRPDDWHDRPDAAECVRLICGILSRTELGTNHAARVIWKQLDDQYLAWKALEHA
jgi:hypothetical protein